MNSKLAIMAGVGLAAALLSGCGGGDHANLSGATPLSGPTIPPSTNQSLTTAGVLALAEKTSETASPFPVNDGALTITDTSDTTAPISVNGM